MDLRPIQPRATDGSSIPTQLDADQPDVASAQRSSFKQAYVFSLTRPCHPHNLAKLSTYRDDADVGSIYLIRHGQASFGAHDYDVLSPIGIRQAQILGEHLANLGVRLDRCIAGGLRRQQHTANAALAQFTALDLPTPDLEINRAFDEFDADAVIRALLPAMLPDEPQALHVMRNAAEHKTEFQRLFALIIGRWLGGNHDTPGLQSWLAFVAQVQSGLAALLESAEPNQHIAVFTSGGTIAALLHLITRMPAQQAFELNWQIVNTSLNQLKFRGREVALASFNSHAHLQLLKMPELITYR
jgi:broad specificity phosphatase PhoE